MKKYFIVYLILLLMVLRIGVFSKEIEIKDKDFKFRLIPYLFFIDHKDFKKINKNDLIKIEELDEKTKNLYKGNNYGEYGRKLYVIYNDIYRLIIQDNRTDKELEKILYLLFSLEMSNNLRGNPNYQIADNSIINYRSANNLNLEFYFLAGLIYYKLQDYGKSEVYFQKLIESIVINQELGNDIYEICVNMDESDCYILTDGFLYLIDIYKRREKYIVSKEYEEKLFYLSKKNEYIENYIKRKKCDYILNYKANQKVKVFNLCHLENQNLSESNCDYPYQGYYDIIMNKNNNYKKLEKIKMDLFQEIFLDFTLSEGRFYYDRYNNRRISVFYKKHFDFEIIYLFGIVLYFQKDYERAYYLFSQIISELENNRLKNSDSSLLFYSQLLENDIYFIIDILFYILIIDEFKKVNKASEYNDIINCIIKINYKYEEYYKNK